MMDLDEILQEQLEALERGVPLENVLAELPPEAAELIPLLKLAVAAHKIPHPGLSMETSRSQRARVMAAAQARRAPARPLSTWASISARLTGRTGFPALAAGLAFIFLFAISAAGIGFYMAGPASAHSVQTIEVNGLVEVSSSPDANDWHFISSGDQLSQGQRIRSYAGSGATLIFFDGSRTVIGSSTDLTLTRLGGGWGSVLQVEMAQNSGFTDQSVVPLRSSRGFFQILTPSGEASVHGTSFSVNVNPKGEALFAVNHGRVQVKNARSEVFLTAGQATAVQTGGDPEKPGYQFSLQGQITSLQDSQWAITGVPYEATSRTEMVGNFVEGDFVLARGRILETGQWLADSIEPANQAMTRLYFTGNLTAKDGDTWTIGGKAIQVKDGTEFGGDPKTGMAVGIGFEVVEPGNTWLAKEIDALEEEGEGPTPTSTVASTATRVGTPTSTPTATETETVTGPSSITTPTPTPTPTVTPTGTPLSPEKNLCPEQTDVQPEGMRLAQRYNIHYTEIEGWFCQGFNFGEIDLAYGLSLQTGKPVSEIFAMRKSGLGWGQIKKELSPVTIPNPRDKDKSPKN